MLGAGQSEIALAPSNTLTDCNTNNASLCGGNLPHDCDAGVAATSAVTSDALTEAFTDALRAPSHNKCGAEGIAITLVFVLWRERM